MRADTTGMIHIALEELADVPHWETLLATYRERQLQEKAANPEEDPWVPRIRALDAVEGEELSQLHGRLIALGLLKFELGGRTSGMSYQVSPLGVRALSGPPSNDEDSDSDTNEQETDEPQLGEGIDLSEAA
jgi:hypothetical protein